MNIDNNLTRADIEPDIFTHSPSYCVEKQPSLEVDFRVISLDAESESVKDGLGSEDMSMNTLPSLAKAYGDNA